MNYNIPESSGYGGEEAAEAALKLDRIGREILGICRDELYFSMRFMDVALSSFVYQMDTAVSPFGTDGYRMYFHPRELGGLYRQNRILVNRGYLHMVLHCIFRHLWMRGNREPVLWNLACDIAVESVIDSMDVRAVRRGRSWLRRETYRRLGEEMAVLTAEKICASLERQALPERKLFDLEREFRADTHRYWPADEDPERKQEIENRWQDQAERMETELETFSKEASSAAGGLLGQLKVENRERCDYREFLRKFAVLREEVSVDPDSFDYVFYSYGLSLYGNMPLIEPQEWKETKKIEDFVIVVDTSMSCSGELVKKFLEETYGVLSEADSFFRHVNIHIIQCDDEVRSDRKITCREELQEYMEHLELHGEGGTDFRPAFAYVGELLKRKEFRQLKGLLYFTDGRGVYPSGMPPYQTAFVFLGEDYEDREVPPWAVKLILEEEDITHSGEKGEKAWI